MFIWDVTGMWPISGSEKLSRLKSALAVTDFFAAPPPRTDEGPPERVVGPPAGRFVIVDEAEAAGVLPPSAWSR